MWRATWKGLLAHKLRMALTALAVVLGVSFVAGTYVLTDTIDLASAHLVFRNGVRANVTASRVSLTPMRRFRMFSSSSYVSLDFTKNYALVVKKGPNWEKGREELRSKDPLELAQRENFVNGELLDVSELELEGLAYGLLQQIGAIPAAQPAPAAARCPVFLLVNIANTIRKIM